VSWTLEAFNTEAVRQAFVKPPFAFLRYNCSQAPHIREYTDLFECLFPQFRLKSLLGNHFDHIFDKLAIRVSQCRCVEFDYLLHIFLQRRKAFSKAQLDNMNQVIKLVMVL